MEKAFNVVCTSDTRRCPGPLEILLVPHVAVAVLVHAPIGEPRGYPVPLGFVSFDESTLPSDTRVSTGEDRRVFCGRKPPPKGRVRAIRAKALVF